MTRRGGVWPGWPAAVAAGVLGVAAAGVGPLAGLTTPEPHHGVHHPQVTQERVPPLPGGSYAPNACHPNTEAPASRAQLNAWITRAGQLLHRPYTADERRIVLVVIDGESGGKVHAINCWDRNWVQGHPSMGLIQAIDTTYLAHAPAGCRHLVLIYDGPCNIAAGTDYAIGRYGSLANIPGVGEVAAGGKYKSGY